MGFGSYDESEQGTQDVDADADAGVTVHENDHDGEVSFDTDASADQLVDRLQDMREQDDE